MDGLLDSADFRYRMRGRVPRPPTGIPGRASGLVEGGVAVKIVAWRLVVQLATITVGEPRAGRHDCWHVREVDVSHSATGCDCPVASEVGTVNGVSKESSRGESRGFPEEPPEKEAFRGASPTCARVRGSFTSWHGDGRTGRGVTQRCVLRRPPRDRDAERLTRLRTRRARSGPVAPSRRGGDQITGSAGRGHRRGRTRSRDGPDRVDRVRDLAAARTTDEAAAHGTRDPRRALRVPGTWPSGGPAHPAGRELPPARTGIRLGEGTGQTPAPRSPATRGIVASGPFNAMPLATAQVVRDPSARRRRGTTSEWQRAGATSCVCRYARPSGPHVTQPVREHHHVVDVPRHEPARSELCDQQSVPRTQHFPLDMAHHEADPRRKEPEPERVVAVFGRTT